MNETHSELNNQSPKRDLFFTNKYDYINPNDEHVLHPEGVDTIEVNPKKRKKYTKDDMVRTLFIDVCKLLQINGLYKEDLIYDYMRTTKRKFAQEHSQIKEEDLVLIYKRAIKRYEQINISPKRRKIIFNKDSKLTTRQKQSVSGKLVAGMRKENTLKKLKSLYKEGMTQVELANLSGLSLRTVKKYWKEITAYYLSTKTK